MYIKVGVTDSRSIWFPVLSIVTFVGCLVVNFTIGQGLAGVFKMKITPPGYFFAIWGLIFMSTGIVLCYILITRQWSDITHIWMSTLSVIICIWLYFTISNLNGKVFFMFFTLVAILVSAFNVWRHIRQEDFPADQYWRYLAIRNTIAFYLGWVSAATCLNFVMMLIYGFDVSQDTGAYLFWPAAAVVVFAFTSYVAKHNDYKVAIGYYISASWGIIGVIMALTNPSNNYRKVL